MTEKQGLRLFTTGEATRTLPLVRRIAEDIAREHDRLEVMLPELRAARLAARQTGNAEDLELIREEVARSSARLEAHLEELKQVGCILHEPSGVVDFRANLEGRPVALCWKLGEPEVAHWHEPGESYLDRRPVPESLAASTVGCDAGD